MDRLEGADAAALTAKTAAAAQGAGGECDVEWSDTSYFILLQFVA